MRTRQMGECDRAASRRKGCPHSEIVKRVHGATFYVFGIDAHVILHQPMKAEVTKADLLLQRAKLLLPVRTKPFVSAPGPDHSQRHGVMRSTGLAYVQRSIVRSVHAPDRTSARREASLAI